jgi:hypothetical protein
MTKESEKKVSVKLKEQGEKLYLVVVLFMCGVERFDYERRMILSTVIRREQIAHGKTRSS